MSTSHTQVSKKRGAAPPAGLLVAQGACGPTPERMEKFVFVADTSTPGSPLRVLGTVQALLNARDITQDAANAANAAERWYRDWVFANVGHIEYPTHHTPNTLTRHDDVSWQMTRAHAAGRVADVRHALGLCAQVRLKLMLVDELSFMQMGQVIFPHLSDARARLKISAQCAMLLEQLEGFYEGLRRAKQRGKTHAHGRSGEEEF
ncbi:hypothetical protein GOB86_10935 [Acetobacter lambici]|uniref:Uncharacterized protein n=1 Tax=Acetobacter lambici TaxID=1332824 RepID=A0ABT1EYQ5_9PROT|nr:hypothetical protein [Acetobacter lambici]MCP1241756.1 hypothetical protein [Acetobacter lambici]MCP1257881.1 hypothetical protein [Acetobacter lambici]NHO57561.1 hypothetical protein [Acetobacter lambici]